MKVQVIASVLLHLFALAATNAKEPKNVRGLQEGPKYDIAVADMDATDPLWNNLAIPNNAAEVGMWTPLQSWPLVSVHIAVLPDGRVITYGSPTNRGVQDGRELAFWDPRDELGSDNVSVSPQAQGVDSFCSSGSLLPDGRYLATGGASFSIGANSMESSTVDYKTQQAVRVQDMKLPRWYGTMTKLPDGRVMTTGGAKPYAPGGQSGISSTPEIYSPQAGWRLMPGARSLDAYGEAHNRYWYPRQWVSPTGSVFGISTDKVSRCYLLQTIPVYGLKLMHFFCLFLRLKDVGNDIPRQW